MPGFGFWDRSYPDNSKGLIVRKAGSWKGGKTESPEVGKSERPEENTSRGVWKEGSM